MSDLSGNSFLRVEAPREADSACPVDERDHRQRRLDELGRRPARRHPDLRWSDQPGGTAAATPGRGRGAKSQPCWTRSGSSTRSMSSSSCGCGRYPSSPVVALEADHDGSGCRNRPWSHLSACHVRAGCRAARTGNRPSRITRSATFTLAPRDCCGSGTSCTPRPPCSPQMIRWRASRRSTSRISWASASSSTTQCKLSTTARSLTGLRSSSLLQEHLGFTFGDFTTVRSAIQERYSRILTSLRDETGDIVMRCQAEGRDPTEEEIRGLPQVDVCLHVPPRRTRIVHCVRHR